MRRLVLAIALVAACGDDGPSDPFTVEELMDPEACMDCHPTHYREWSGSMHAYAADDPVFLAMNALGQEVTGGELGDFCVNCHAPMAVRLGLTSDGLDLDEVPQYAKGVTCYFCHSVESVGQDHSNDLTLATDEVLRGGIRDAVPNPRHRTGYSPLLDSLQLESSRMCGGCHDLVTPVGVHLEKTFAEWKETVFATGEPQSQLSCNACHLTPKPGTAAEDPDIDVPLRVVRDHRFPGIDVALTPWPEIESQREAIEEFLAPTLTPRICVTPLEGGRLDLRLDNVGAGHSFPSGAAHDRRAWAEVHVYDDAGKELFATGVVPDGVDPEDVGDPNLWEMRERVFDDEGNEVLFFWDVRSVDTDWLLEGTVTLDPLDPRYDHSQTRSWNVNGFFQDIARVTAEVHIRPLPFKLIDALVASGHLDPTLADEIRAALPTFTLEGSRLEWTREAADVGGCVDP